jgi:hypothetical protein
MSESTVSKTKETGAAAPKRKTITNWRVFEEGGFVPVKIRCDGYLGSHPADLSCHTSFPPTAENVARHMDPAHGGGWFRIKFRISDKPSLFWRSLEEAGVELADFYCPHCRENITVSPRRIEHHLKNHPGANRVNLDPQTLAMTLTTDRPNLDELDDLYETGVED